MKVDGPEIVAVLKRTAGLEDRPKRPIRRYGLPWTPFLAVDFDGGFAVPSIRISISITSRTRTNIPEGEAHKESLIHLLVSVRHILQRGLLIMHLFVLGHIRLV